MIPADCVIICNSEVSSSESALTGESEDMRKSRRVDCFLLSSCLITDGDGCRALVIGIGLNSQWGKIKANLVTNSVNTPLQDKLEIMTKRVSEDERKEEINYFHHCLMYLPFLLPLFHVVALTDWLWRHDSCCRNLHCTFYPDMGRQRSETFSKAHY